MDENTNIQTNDVNTQTDTQTAGDSSSATQQTSDAQNQDNSSASNENGNSNASETLADGSNADTKVPIHVVQETRQELQAAKKELAEMRQWRQQQEQLRVQQTQDAMPKEMREARDQLKGLLKDLAPELGFVSKEEIQQQNAFNEVKTEHDRLASKYTGKDGLPKYDEQAVTDYAVNVLGMRSAKGLEAAYKLLNEAEITNARLEAAIAKTRGVKSERSNGTGSANTGVSNDDLLKAAQSGDKTAQLTLIKRRLAKS